MNLDGFSDELQKLAASGTLPLHAIGALMRRALVKHASGLGAFREEAAPRALDVDPADASTRPPSSSRAMSQIRPGVLGGVTPSANPIDRDRFNRVWEPAR